MDSRYIEGDSQRPACSQSSQSRENTVSSVASQHLCYSGIVQSVCQQRSSSQRGAPERGLDSLRGRPSSDPDLQICVSGFRPPAQGGGRTERCAAGGTLHCVTGMSAALASLLTEKSSPKTPAPMASTLRSTSTEDSFTTEKARLRVSYGGKIVQVGDFAAASLVAVQGVDTQQALESPASLRLHHHVFRLLLASFCSGSGPSYMPK